MIDSQSQVVPTVGHDFARKSLGVTAALSISAVLEFSRDVYIARAIGTGMLTDAYFLAIVVPITLGGAINAVGQVVFLPWFGATLSEDPGEISERLFLLAIVALLPTLLIIFSGALFSPLVARLMAGSAIDEELLATVTRIILPVVGLSIELAIFSAFLNASGRYITVGLRKAVNSMVFLVVLILVGSDITASKLGWAFLAGYVVELLTLFYLVFPNLSSGSGVAAFRHRKELFIVLKGSIFPVLVFGLARINLIAERVFAGFLTVGSVTAVTLARRSTLAVAAIASRGINTVTLSQMSKMQMASKRLMKLASSLRLALLILVPIATLFVVFHKQIALILFASRQSDPAVVEQTAELMLLFGIGVPFYVLAPLFLGAFYSVGDTRTPSIQKMVAVALNLILNFLLIWSLGTQAIGISFVITVVFSTAWAWLSINNRFGRFTGHWLVPYIIRILVASVALAVASYSVFRVLVARVPSQSTLSAAISLAISFAVGALFLCVFLYAFNVEEVQQTWRQVRYRVQSSLR